MAIATLAECYDNEKVFEGVVKIRRGLSARIMLSSSDTRIKINKVSNTF